MRQVYLAHPLSAKYPNGQVNHLGILQNLQQAKLWYKWACDHYWPDHCFNAMWILNCEVYNDADARERDIGMQRSYAHIKRCDELWLLGPLVSPGMEDEAKFARRCQIPVYDLTSEGMNPVTAPVFPVKDMPLWKAGSLSQQALGFR